jgi:hypothetical protein
MEEERGRSDPGHCPEFKDLPSNLLAINSQHAVAGCRALSYKTIIFCEVGGLVQLPDSRWS